MTEKTTQTTARPVVTTKRAQWDLGPRCPRCGEAVEAPAEYQTLCDACACIEIEIENRRRTIDA